MNAGSHHLLRGERLGIAVAMMKGTKMKKSAILSVLVLGLAAALAAAPAFATNVLYGNGSSTYTVDGWTFGPASYGYKVTDSFPLLSSSTVTGANFDVWLFPGDTLSSVDWLITTGPFSGTTEGSGTASTTNTSIEINEYGYDIDEESFSISSLSLGAGTYWLQLKNGVVPNGDPVYWDESDGPSLAQENEVGKIGSETFQILGDTGPVVPEPSSFLLLGSGLAGLAGLLKRKFRA